ncbi:unnamed protein product [Rotaria sp. Silwood1]|nr:unnamed protein product [Rotaria sp. Silwood1]
MSDYDDDDHDMAPNYDKMRGMGFICWREISATDDENHEDIQLNKKKKKKKKKRKLDAIETEQEIETPIKKVKTKKKKRSNETHMTSTLQITNENNKDEVETTTNNDSIEIAKKVWSDLYVSENIIRSLLEQKFFDPTPIQRLTLPTAIRDRLDIIGAAETGSGKTLAFAIPILTHMSKLLENNEVSSTYYFK